MNDAADALAEIEATRARVEAQVREAEARRAGVDRLAGDLQSLTAVVRSPRSEVTVTAQPSGRILAVELATAAERLGAVELGRLISATVAAAQHEAAQAAVARAERDLGESSAFVTQLRSEALDTFPGPDTGNDIGYR